MSRTGNPKPSDNGQKSKTVREPAALDRRAERSRKLIKDALTGLLHSRRFDSISVQDIIDRAGVGRSTFYAHFQDKDDLVTKFFEGMMADLAGGTEAGVPPLENILAKLKTQAAAGGLWTDARGREFLFTVGQAYWIRRMEADLAARIPPGRNPAVPPAVIAQMTAGAANALILWWLKNKMPIPPEEMQRMFDRVLQQGIPRAIEPAE